MILFEGEHGIRKYEVLEPVKTPDGRDYQCRVNIYENQKMIWHNDIVGVDRDQALEGGLIVLRGFFDDEDLTDLLPTLNKVKSKAALPVSTRPLKPPSGKGDLDQKDCDEMVLFEGEHGLRKYEVLKPVKVPDGRYHCRVNIYEHKKVIWGNDLMGDEDPNNAVKCALIVLRSFFLNEDLSGLPPTELFEDRLTRARRENKRDRRR